MTDVTMLYLAGALEPPAVPASEGESGLDISTLLATTGDVAYDPGFVNTASCSSAITFIDGEKGIPAPPRLVPSNSWLSAPRTRKLRTC